MFYDELCHNYKRIPMEEYNMLNNILYYLILQNLQARIRNAGGNLMIQKNDMYRQGEADYATLPISLQRDLTIASQKNTETILKENPDYFFRPREKQAYIDVKCQDITLIQFDFSDGSENITYLCKVK